TQANALEAGHQPTVIGLLEGASRELEGQELDPAVAWKLNMALARSFMGNGRREDALKHARRALELAEHLQPPDPEATRETSHILGTILTTSGKYAEAELTLDSVLAARERDGVQGGPDFCFLLNDVAVIKRRLGKLD